MRKIIIIVLVAFVIYFLVTDSGTLADVLGGIGDLFAQIFESIIDLFDNLFS